MDTRVPFKVFISYSYDNQVHRDWVLCLAEQLRHSGLDVIFDEWHLKLGQSITEFMERSVINSDYVLVICTPKYAKKSNERKGGVGYEQQIISGQLLYGTPREKFIPVIRSGSLNGTACALPGHFIATKAIDFRKVKADQIADSMQFNKLVGAIFSLASAEPPPSGNLTFDRSAQTKQLKETGYTKRQFQSQDAALLDQIHVYAENMLEWERLRELDRFQLQLIAKCNSQQTSLFQVLEEHPRLVITGSPGSSKTVFMLKTLKSLCLALKATLNVSPKQLVSPEVPLYIELGLLGPIGDSVICVPYPRNTLINTIIGKLAPLSQTDNPLLTFAGILDKCQVILLLDGLNELPRDYQLECVKELFSLEQQLIAIGKHKKLKIAVTSRLYNFTNYFSRQGWDLAEILPLEAQAIKQELSKSLGESTASEVLRQGGAKFRQLLSNPQHLNCFIEWCQDEMKAGRRTERVIGSKGAILKSCANRKLQEFDQRYIFVVETFLSQLAFETTKVSPFFAYTHALNIASKTVRSYHSKLTVETLMDQVFSNGILVRLQNRSEVRTIECEGCDIVITDYACRFEHHSVQQYFAACWMGYLWRLNEYVTDRLLHEALVIMAGILERDRLLELLKKIEDDQCLSAYVLANVLEPELEKKLLARTIDQFIQQTDQWATRLSRILIVLFGLWFLTIPFLAYFLLANPRAPRSVFLQGVSICLSLAYLFVSPALLLRWHMKQFAGLKARLQDNELPNVIVVLRYLLARGAMNKVRGELIGLLGRVKGDDQDPRKAFLTHAVDAVSRAVGNSSYMTEDEMLEQLDDPLIAAELDPKAISSEGVVKLLRKAENPDDDISALAAMDLLKDWYLSNEQADEEFARLLVTIAVDRNRVYSRRRRRHATRLCRTLRIPLPSQPSWIRRVCRSFLAVLKRLVITA